MIVLVASLTVAVALLGVLVVGLLRSHAEILRALHQSGVVLDPDGEPAQDGPTLDRRLPSPSEGAGSTRVADIEGVTPRLEPIVVSVNGRGRLTLLAFLSSGCLTCRSFWEAFADTNLAVPGNARLVVVVKGPEAESPSDIVAVAATDVLTVMSTEAWAAYQVPGSPYFVLVDGEQPRVIGEGTAATWPKVERLMSSALADGRHVAGGGHHHGTTQSADSESRADAELRAAGIGHGHPSLYPHAEPEPPATGAP
jgi:hypothetical protein